MVSSLSQEEFEAIENLGIRQIFFLKEVDQLCKQIFIEEDEDLSGYLGKDSIGQIIQSIAYKLDDEILPNEDIQEIVESFDINQDGQFSFVELKILLSFIFIQFSQAAEQEAMIEQELQQQKPVQKQPQLQQQKPVQKQSQLQQQKPLQQQPQLQQQKPVQKQPQFQQQKPVQKQPQFQQQKPVQQQPQLQQQKVLQQQKQVQVPKKSTSQKMEEAVYKYANKFKESDIGKFCIDFTVFAAQKCTIDKVSQFVSKFAC